MSNYTQRIQEQYRTSSKDAGGLFAEIMLIANQIGFDEALAILEQCVIEKRLAWLKTNLVAKDRQATSAFDGYDWFYERYLRVSCPDDGKIVEQTPTKIITRWWNPCPTLDACLKFGLDTRQVCKKAYHKPVDIFLKQIHPQLQFSRNYACIRPQADYCEEIIEFTG